MNLWHSYLVAFSLIFYTVLVGGIFVLVFYFSRIFHLDPNTAIGISFLSVPITGILLVPLLFWCWDKLDCL